MKQVLMMQTIIMVGALIEMFVRYKLLTVLSLVGRLVFMRIMHIFLNLEANLCIFLYNVLKSIHSPHSLLYS